MIEAHPRPASRPDPIVPPRWTLSLWARAFRRLTHWWLVGRHVRRFCRPLSVEGLENLDGIQGRAIFIANHTSHFDAYLLRHILPGHLRSRAAMAAAADRWYTKKRLRTKWFSLVLNIYPIQRGGGSSALDHSHWLLDNGWSLIIFPEGTRAKKGHMEALKYGVAMLALSHRATVVPIVMDGAGAILPPGERKLRQAPVAAKVGRPVTFEPGTAIPEATARLQQLLEELADADVQHERTLELVA